MLVGLGNESHVAGACPCCVVGWEGGGQEGERGQSQQADDAPHTLCKRRHANSKLLTLQERSSPPLASPRLPSPPLAPGTPSLLTGAVGTVVSRPPSRQDPSVPVERRNRRRGPMQADK